MRKIIIAFALLTAIVSSSCGTLDPERALSAGLKGVQALTISDAQMASYVKESVDYMDANNTVAPANNAYTVRLRKLTQGLTDVNGTPLNFKVYLVKDVNAFACPDGSVRVFSSLMDIMDDDELLGIIGHEIGHVAKHHSRKQFQNQLLTSALMDAAGAASSTVASLTDSQLGSLATAYTSARYSQKQEKEADDYGYDFLKSHGKNPLGMLRSFQKLQSIEQKSGASQSTYLQKMFSSHPDTQERIDRITARAKKDGLLK